MNAIATRSTWPLAATQPPGARPRPTWAEWCAAQERRIARQRRFGDLPFSDRELAHLAFVRWLHQTDRTPL
ncbi:MAG TPA: hypothetical protein VFU88_21695 [Ktedonobacterales bacterium]|nr:hypothetical protein [Ktedonobacterales bacterium]